MKIMFDTNILLDVFQNRQPHYVDSASCVDLAVRGAVEGVLPAHVLTTFYYVLSRYRDAQTARAAVRWLLTTFFVASCDRAGFEEACCCGMPDFEDAVVAMSARAAKCDAILTRNLVDFTKSPIPAVSPAEFLQQIRAN